MVPHPLSLLKKLPAFLLTHAIATSAFAQVYYSSVSSAVGGTGRAAVEEADAAFLNPSTMVHLKGHHIYLSAKENEYAVLLMDSSKESFLPAALGFVEKKVELANGEMKIQDITFSLAEFVVNQWSVGLTGHYKSYASPQESFRKINADLGVLYTPQSNIGWALVGYNLFGEAPEASANFKDKTYLGGGFAYIYNSMLRLRLDATTKSEFMAGMESYMNKFFIIRMGYMDDRDQDRSLWTLGLGFKGPRFVINYAYQANPQSSGDYRHSIDLGIPF